MAACRTPGRAQPANEPAEAAPEAPSASKRLRRLLGRREVAITATRRGLSTALSEIRSRRVARQLSYPSSESEQEQALAGRAFGGQPPGCVSGDRPGCSA